MNLFTWFSPFAEAVDAAHDQLHRRLLKMHD